MSPDPLPESGQEPRASVVIVAAGVSRRMVDVDKVFAPLLEKPLIAHTVAPFEDCPQVGEIVLVLHRDNLERGRRLVEVEGWRKVSQVCPGGERRQDSVKAGLDSLSPCRLVMVHDGARPCVTQDTLRRCIQEAEHTGAAIPTVPVNDTVKKVDAEGIVVSTVPREELRAVQTPQVFRYDLLRKAYQGDLDEVTDDASLVEKLGHEVRVFDGSPDNIKITTQIDLLLAEAILRNRAGR